MFQLVGKHRNKSKLNNELHPRSNSSISVHQKRMWNEYRHLFVNMVVVNLITKSKTVKRKVEKKTKKNKTAVMSFPVPRIGEVD